MIMTAEQTIEASQKLIKDFIDESTDEMVAYIQTNIYKDFECKQRTVSFSSKRRTSRGGHYGFDRYGYNLSLPNIPYYVRTEAIDGTTADVFFSEYAHIRENETIGEFTSHWSKYVLGLLAHEIAHAVDYAICDHGHAERCRTLARHSMFATFKHHPTRDSGHGRSWQFIYRLLRDKFVNGKHEIRVATLEDLQSRVKRTNKIKLRAKEVAKYTDFGDQYKRTIYVNVEDGTTFAITETISSRDWWTNKMIHDVQVYINDKHVGTFTSGALARKAIFDIFNGKNE